MPERPRLEHLVAVPTGSPGAPATDVEGWDLDGRARTLRVASPGRWTLLVFLGARCDGCRPFWSVAGAPTAVGLSARDEVVVVTRGPEEEDPTELAGLVELAGLAELAGPPELAAPPGAPERSRGIAGALVMSDAAWGAYRVHGPPFFVLLDGVKVVVEGVLWSLEQLAADVARARRRGPGEAGRRRSARR